MSREEEQSPRPSFWSAPKKHMVSTTGSFGLSRLGRLLRYAQGARARIWGFYAWLTQLIGQDLGSGTSGIFGVTHAYTGYIVRQLRIGCPKASRTFFGETREPSSRFCPR